ncbi:MAG: hypothetical protein HOV76_18075 [Hamadaea sp.]|nr:hypothetical protein [Hamadaea sp.]
MRNPVVPALAATLTALIFATPTLATPTPQATNDTWVVSVGDSYISGEAGRWAGNTDESDTSKIDALGPTAYFDNATGTAELIPGCHRSKSAEIIIGGGVRSKNLACSGALTNTVASDSNFKPGLDFYQDSRGRQGQARMLQEFAAAHTVRMVVISIGGNDFGFGPVVQNCAIGFLTGRHCHTDYSVTEKIKPAFVAAVTDKIVHAYRNIHTAMSQAGYRDDQYTLLIQNYPQAVPPYAAENYRYPQKYERATTGHCGLYDDDSDWATGVFLTVVKAAVARAVALSQLTNVQTLDLTTAFASRRLCENTVKLIEKTHLTRGWDPVGADMLEWIDSIQVGSANQKQESLHPNYWAQLALRNCVRMAYNGGRPRSGACRRPAKGGGLNQQKEPSMEFFATSPATYGKALFAGSQDSIAGGEQRGSVAAQLDAGVRQLAFDVRSQNGSLVVGGPNGSGVDTSGGNPKVFDLGSWLGVIATWLARDENKFATPITVVLDARTPFSTEDSLNLNRLLRTVFGDRLAHGDLSKTKVSDLYGKVVPVLSGNATARLTYVRDPADVPAVGINNAGMVITVQQGEKGSLWYWTGRVEDDGTVTWLANNKYDTGKSPAVVLTDTGTILEVHETDGHALHYRLGTLDTAGRVRWQTIKEPKYTTGLQPTLKLLDDNTVAEIHTSEHTGRHWRYFGTMGRDAVRWHDGTVTTMEPFRPYEAYSDGWEINVRGVWMVDGQPRDAMSYQLRRSGTLNAPYRPIIQPQLAGVECLRGDGRQVEPVLRPYCWSYSMRAGTDTSDKKYLNDIRAKGFPLRAWEFSEGKAGSPAPSFAETPTPYEQWYWNYLAAHDVVW